MRIGINLVAILPCVSGGMEYYVSNLLDSLLKHDRSNKYVLFVNQDSKGIYNYKWPNVEIVSCKIYARPQWRRVVWEQMRLPFLAKKYRLDLLHSPTYTWPVGTSVIGVVSILDMLYCIHPDCIPKLKLAFWKIFVPWSAKRCRKIITISEASKMDIAHYLKVPAEKISVTPLALDKSFETMKNLDENMIEVVCKKYQFRRPYLLCVGGGGRHKNSIALVKALAILRDRVGTEELSLVITGNFGGVERKIKNQAIAMGLDSHVRLPGYVSRKDLPAIYSGALAYVTPSIFEGFGLTVLEAMASQTPVIISDRTSLPEVAGNAALKADPDRPDMIADAVSRIASDSCLRNLLIQRGIQRVNDFSWDRTATLTLDAYREAASENVWKPQ